MISGVIEREEQYYLERVIDLNQFLDSFMSMDVNGILEEKR